MASPAASVTGSLLQGVRRNSWAFSAQVYADPLSEMTVPNSGLARTFTQGAGVTAPGAVVTMYSRPSGVKPPSPLKNTRSVRGTGGGAAAGAKWIRDGANRGGAWASGLAPTCSSSEPRLSVMM